MRWQVWGVGLSIAVHAGAVLAVAFIPKETAKKSHLIAVVDKKRKNDKKDDDKPAKADEPPPPPPKPVTPPKPKRAPKVENTPPPPSTPPPSAAAAAHPQIDALPKLNLTMTGGPGAGGISVPTGPTGPADPGPAHAADAPKGPAPKPKDDCTEDPVKPKLVGAIPQDRIIAAAQAAGGVEGKIRLELQVDETGNITSVRVTTGLGGAIDEAALSAARRAKVTPSTRCGRPVAGRLVVAITVRNPD